MKLFYIPIFFLFVAVLFFGFKNGFSGVSCHTELVGGSCLNPMFGRCSNDALCGLEYLPNGYEYNVFPLWVDYAPIVMVLFVVIFFVINHFRYNKDFFVKED